MLGGMGLQLGYGCVSGAMEWEDRDVLKLVLKVPQGSLKDKNGAPAYTGWKGDEVTAPTKIEKSP